MDLPAALQAEPGVPDLQHPLQVLQKRIAFAGEWMLQNLAGICQV